MPESPIDTEGNSGAPQNQRTPATEKRTEGARPRAWLRPKLRVAALIVVVGGIGAFAIWKGHATHSAESDRSKRTPVAVVATPAAATPAPQEAVRRGTAAQ